MKMKNSPYQHIVGSNLLYNDVDSCVYLDGISKITSIYKVLTIAEYIFSDFGFKISQIVVADRDGYKSKIRSARWIKDNSVSLSENKFKNIKSIQFFSTKRGTVDETWRPEIYFSITFGYKTNSAFFSIRNADNRDVMSLAFDRMSGLCEFCAGYLYDFPSILSSLGYYWGVIVEPRNPSEGRYGEGNARRLEVWRDNTEIGIVGSQGRKFYGVCDGYVRDVYPTMILSECHRRREVNGESLVDFIAKSLPVSVEQVGNKIWFRIQSDDLLKVQQSFDESQISLSGRRIVH